MKLCFIFGTRPEAIKMVPVIKEAELQGVDYAVLLTGQHKELLDEVIELFDIKVYKNLNIMKPNQSLEMLTSNLVTLISKELDDIKPDVVLVHGDTTTTMVGALAAFYKKIPVGHIEAGLRTNNIYQPWPEEINRRIVGQIAQFNFAPGEKERLNLIYSMAPGNIFKVGNTIVDSINLIKQEIGPTDKFRVLITTHRRENWGHLDGVYKAINELAEEFTNVVFTVLLHPNPNLSVRSLITSDKVEVRGPQNYKSMAQLLSESLFAITDSGGIQEEAPSYGCPTLVARNVSERMATVEMGSSKLLGTDYNKIKSEASKLLSSEEYYQSMVPTENPYGDGHTSGRIINILKNWYENNRN